MCPSRAPDPTPPEAPALRPARAGRPVLIGVAAGLSATVAFAWVHDLLISDIWFSLAPMLMAGGVCGAVLAWGHHRLVHPASQRTWLRWVGWHTAVLLGLAGASVVLLDPVVPMAAVVAANEPPTELIRVAAPLTALFAVGAAALGARIWGRGLRGFGVHLATTSTVLLLLGLNVSVLGLVEPSDGAGALVAGFLGLTVLLMVGYGLAFLLLGGASGRAGPDPGRSGTLHRR